MVSVLDVGTPPKPFKVYVGTFNTPVLELYVEAPDEPVTVREIAALARALV